MTEGDMFVMTDKNQVLSGAVDFAHIDALDKLECDGGPGTRTARFPKPGQVLDYELRSRCKRTLKNFAGMVKFDLAYDDFGHSWPGEGPLTKKLNSQYPRGCLSVIGFPHHFLTEMIEYTRAFNQCPDNYEWNQRRFMELSYAETLIHELGHALQLAFQGRRYSESFYKNSVMCEAGYDLTARIFGGSYNRRGCHNPVTTHPHPLENLKAGGFPVLALTPLPIGAGALYNRYLQLNASISGRWVQGTHDVITKIQPAFVCEFFREEFWENVVPTYGSNALIPKKAPQWIASNKLDAGPRLDMWTLSYVDDPELSFRGEHHLLRIIRRRKGFEAQEDEMLLAPLRDLWTSPSTVPGEQCCVE